MKTTYEERAIRFIEKTLAPALGDCPRDLIPTACKAFASAYNQNHKRQLQYDHGSTRYVFIRSDYVIKVSYDNSWGDNWDEVKGYAKAVEAGYERYFAKPTLIEVDGLEYEIMPRVKNIASSRFDWECILPEHIREWVDNNYEDLHEYNVGYHKGQPIFIDYACLV